MPTDLHRAGSQSAGGVRQHPRLRSGEVGVGAVDIHLLRNRPRVPRGRQLTRIEGLSHQSVVSHKEQIARPHVLTVAGSLDHQLVFLGGFQIAHQNRGLLGIARHAGVQIVASVGKEPRQAVGDLFAGRIEFGCRGRRSPCRGYAHHGTGIGCEQDHVIAVPGATADAGHIGDGDGRSTRDIDLHQLVCGEKAKIAAVGSPERGYPIFRPG